MFFLFCSVYYWLELYTLRFQVKETAMGYILITARKHGSPVVTWNESRRVGGKATPVRDTIYLGLAVNNETELLKSAMLKELTAEVESALAGKGLTISRQAALPRGPRPTFLRRIPLDAIENSVTQDIGVYRLLRGLAQDSGLLQALFTAFGDGSEAIFALVCQRLDSRLQSYLFQDWAADSPFELVKLSMSPKSISSLLSRLECGRLSFAREWYKACGSPDKLIEDSTHFCTYASANGGRRNEEYGWEHHQNVGRRQINVMSLVAMDSRLPIMYRAYPGSINDISTFLETSEEMEVIGKNKAILYASDSGYFSNFNMMHMTKNHKHFIMEGKWDTQTLMVLEEKRNVLKGSGSYVKHGSYTYRHESCTYVLHDSGKGGRKCAIGGYIYYSELEASQERNAMIATILLWQKAFGKYDFESRQHAQEWLDTSTDNWGKYLAISGEIPNLCAEIRHGMVSEATERMGFHVLVSSDSRFTAAEVLDICHGRDPVEKLWRTIKTDLNSKSLHTKLDDTTQGQIFIVWCAAIMQRLLRNKIANAGMECSVNEILLAMHKVRLLVIDGKNHPQTLTKKAKEAIVAMKMEKYFPEFDRCLQPLVELRESRQKAEGKHRGRPRKYKLKVQKTNSMQDIAKKKQDEKQLAPQTLKRRGRPPKK